MAFHLLSRHREKGNALAHCLQRAMQDIDHCQQCNTFCELALCKICSNTKRDQNLLCVVESPADIAAIEQTNSYSGHYFVLMGHLSPLDGIGPNEIAIAGLIKRLNHSEISEVILATNPTVEGEATAHYIAELVKQHHIKASRIAHGVPLGCELELIDGGTLAHAFAGREVV